MACRYTDLLFRAGIFAEPDHFARNGIVYAIYAVRPRSLRDRKFVAVPRFGDFCVFVAALKFIGRICVVCTPYAYQFPVLIIITCRYI